MEYMTAVCTKKKRCLPGLGLRRVRCDTCGQGPRDSCINISTRFAPKENTLPDNTMQTLHEATLAVAKRDGGAMILSPQGAVLAEGNKPDDIAVADLNPFGRREGGDALNAQVDMRARLFRERNPAAYGLLTDPNPPALKKVPATITVDQAVRLWEKLLATGQDRFQKAEDLLKAGKTQEAIQSFEKLRTDFRGTWVDRSARKQLAALRSQGLR
jgi:hypothetical protein